MNVGKVRILRGNEALGYNKSSIELFKSMNPNIDCTRIKDILSDMIFIVVKDVCFDFSKKGEVFKRFNPQDISGTVVKYVSIFIDTKDEKVLVLLEKTLTDIYLYENEKSDRVMMEFISTIYSKIMELLP